MALRVRLACGSHVPVASWWFSGAFWTSAAHHTNCWST